MIGIIIPGHSGINGYRVVVDPLVANGYLIDHGRRLIIFAVATARSMCRRVRRRRARANGRRNAVRVALPSFAQALDALIEDGS